MEIIINLAICDFPGCGYFICMCLRCIVRNCKFMSVFLHLGPTAPLVDHVYRGFSAIFKKCILSHMFPLKKTGHPKFSAIFKNPFVQNISLKSRAQNSGYSVILPHCSTLAKHFSPCSKNTIVKTKQ